MADEITAIAMGALALILALAGIVMPLCRDYSIYGKLQIGLLETRPEIGTYEQWFYANDTHQMFYWATEWIEVPLGDGGGEPPDDYDIYGKVLTGTHVERPSPDINDMWYYETDTEDMFYAYEGEWLRIEYVNSTTFSAHLADYDTLFADFQTLNISFYEHISDYNILFSDFQTFNTTFYEHIADYNLLLLSFQTLNSTFYEHINDADAHHRAWNWADEQSWQRTLVLPLSDQNGWTRDANNPLLQGSGTVGAFDRYGVAHPCVIYYNNTYYMFYSGYRTGVGDWRTGGIGVATCSAKNGIFTKSGNNPIVDLVHEGSTWTDTAVPSVVYDPFESSANKWKMWFIYGNNLPTPIWKIGYAYATDPEGPWTKYASNPVYATDLFWGHSVVRLGNLYYMAVPTLDMQNIKVLTSSDGITWALYQNVLTVGAAGTWDVTQIRFCGIFWNLGVWYVLYSGYDGTNFRIGLSLSSNGMSYTKWMRNPVVDLGVGGQWDAKFVLSPHLLMMENEFLCYYTGYDASDEKRIGLATIP